MEQLYLAVDGGGTHCRVRLYDSQQRLLGSGSGGSANVSLGLANSFAQIIRATDSALVEAGLDHSAFRRISAGLGLAGVVSDEIAEQVASFEHPFAKAVVNSDAVAACLGAHAGADGAILILGTGSCAVVKQGEKWRNIGGWGWRLSDHGSGAWLGQLLLSKVLQAAEGIIPASAITEALLEQFEGQPSAIYSWSLTATPRDYAAFMPQLFAAAEQQDRLALDLVNQAAGEVERLLDTVWQYTENCCLMGGLSEPLSGYLAAEYQNRLASAKGDALDGALLMAREPSYGR